MKRKILFDIFAIRAQKVPRNRLPDFYALRGVTNTKNVSKPATIRHDWLPLLSTGFYPDGNFLGNTVEKSGR
jgi:hypothetical protein